MDLQMSKKTEQVLTGAGLLVLAKHQKKTCTFVHREYINYANLLLLWYKKE
jgi:predicted deacetylase